MRTGERLQGMRFICNNVRSLSIPGIAGTQCIWNMFLLFLFYVATSTITSYMV